MCWSEGLFLTVEEMNKIHYCPNHPTVSLGKCSRPMPGYRYQYYCPQCIVNTIAAIPTQADDHPSWFNNIKMDSVTIQIVLDVLDQKLGLIPDDTNQSPR